MRFTTKVSSSQEARVAKSAMSDQTFTFSVKKSEVSNGAAMTGSESEGASGGEPLKKSSTLNVNREQIEDFTSVRDKIFP